MVFGESPAFSAEIVPSAAIVTAAWGGTSIGPLSPHQWVALYRHLPVSRNLNITVARVGFAAIGQLYRQIAVLLQGNIQRATTEIHRPLADIHTGS